MTDLVKGLRGELLDCNCHAFCYGECCCDTTWPESLCRDAADEIERLEELLQEAYADADDVLRPYVKQLQDQLAACQKEQDKSLRHYVAKELREMAGDEFQGVTMGWRYKLRRRADELENGK